MSIDIRTIPYQSTWPIRHAVMWPDKPFDFVILPEDESGHHLGLFVGTELISIVSVFFSSNEAQFRKFATVTDQQGKGYGSKLLQHLMSELESQGLERIWCNARVEKSSYYERFGLSATKQTYTKGGLQFVIMEKLL